jgi:hypothetical protein
MDAIKINVQENSNHLIMDNLQKLVKYTMSSMIEDTSSMQVGD